MRICTIILTFTFLINSVVHGQEVKPDELTFHCDVMFSASLEQNRMHSSKVFKEKFKAILNEENSFKDQFDNLRQWISFQEDKKSKLRVITWQLDTGDGFKHFGFVQFNDGRLIELYDASDELEEFEFDQLSPDQWYGITYYKIMNFDKNKYLLLGYDALKDQNRRKVADVLVVDGEDIYFGDPVFVMKEDDVRPTVKSRIVLDFSAYANVRLNYDEELNMLVHDNLIPLQGMDNGFALVQDGSYCGYTLKNGKWYFKEKLFDHTVDTPPMDGKEKERANKDLFGKDK